MCRRTCMTLCPARWPDHPGRSAAPAELPSDEERDEQDPRREREEHQRGGHPKGSADGERERGDRRLLWREAGIEIVDQGLRLETEVLRVGAEESLRIGCSRESVEPLLFERSEIAGSNLRGGLEVDELEASADPGLAQTGADLRHGSWLSLLRSRPSSLGTRLPCGCGAVRRTTRSSLEEMLSTSATGRSKSRRPNRPVRTSSRSG